MLHVSALTRRMVLSTIALLVVGCQKEKPGANSRNAPAGPSRLAKAEPFKAPESVKYDGELDLYYVTNINGGPSQKDNNGFISRMSAEGAITDTAFIQGGVRGVTLHAPKGMALVGDTLWVADIDAVRGFNRRTGDTVASINLRPMGAFFLNDIAVGPDSALYVTDTGILIDAAGKVTHPGRDGVFRIGPDRKPSIAIQRDSMEWPNGITWDASNRRFVMVGFGGKTVFGWAPGDSALTAITSGPGSYDGVEFLADGRMLVTSWADSSVWVYQGTTGDRLITGVPSPADIGLDTRRNQLAIPLLSLNRVELWSLGK
jgi:hypothetical protein